MNERIFELALRAKLHGPLVLQHWGEINALTDSEQEELENIEKFAELIVRECVNKIIMEQDNADQNWSCKNGVHIAWEMLDHFGVDK